MVDVLMLEPFFGGSHKQLIDTITASLLTKNISFDLLTLPAKKWHWKARTSAVEFYSQIDASKSYQTIFCSSVLNVCELVGLCPWLLKCKKVVYFHENQLEYPVQKQQERDFQYAYNQILSALAADTVLFNSNYNMNSFLSKINSTLKKIPRFKPNCIANTISSKCEVLYFPVVKPNFRECVLNKSNSNILHILWAHRWEHDKNPETFFNVLTHLKEEGLCFHVTVMGEQFSEIPSIFGEAKDKLGEEFIKQWGYVDDKDTYYSMVACCDVAVSTALHEFFGVSMIESVLLGCLPLCPNRLVYPEIFPKICLYNTQQQFFKKLRQYCKNKALVKVHYDEAQFNLERFDWCKLEKRFLSYLK